MKRLLIIILLTIPIIVKAESQIEQDIQNNGFYINSQGVKINSENYNKIKNFIRDEEIEKISPRYYQLIAEGGEIIGKDSAYFETYTITDAIGNNITNTREISKQEYNNVDINKISRDTSHSTSYKEITIIQTSATGSLARFVVQVSWKKLPENRSFDVIAYRTSSSSIIYEFESYQEYVSNGTASEIYYDETSTNFKSTNYGAGVSQNLVNNATSYYHTLTAVVNCGATKVYATFQHAQGDLTLAQSQSYTFSSSGYGGVLNFTDTTARNTYDQMGGVSLNLIC